MNAIKLGIIGLGTVGAGTVNVLRRNQADISGRAGRDLTVCQIAVRDLTKPRACETGDIDMTVDPWAVVNNPEIDIVVELMGGETLVSFRQRCVTTSINSTS